ncbi:MAG: transporter [Candidatus Scalinduaceae bacterium]
MLFKYKSWLLPFLLFNGIIISNQAFVMGRSFQSDSAVLISHEGLQHGSDTDSSNQQNTHQKGLHFSHPLFTESPSPDKKIRMDYFFKNLTREEGDQHTPRLEAEYAFFRNLSVEVDVPYTFQKRFVEPSGRSTVDRLDNVEIGLKYANFMFEDAGLLLGGGLELGLPTGNDKKGIGSNNELEIEPFLDFGYKPHPDWEIVGFVSLGFPTNENITSPAGEYEAEENEAGEDEADQELGWNLSILYHLSPRIETLLEFHGESVFGGEEDGFSSVRVGPGIKVQLTNNPNLQIGVGTSFPLADDRESDFESIFSLFYHF